jgi:hypothetical protein
MSRYWSRPAETASRRSVHTHCAAPGPQTPGGSSAARFVVPDQVTGPPREEFEIHIPLLVKLQAGLRAGIQRKHQRAQCSFVWKVVVAAAVACADFRAKSTPASASSRIRSTPCTDCPYTHACRPAPAAGRTPAPSRTGNPSFGSASTPDRSFRTSCCIGSGRPVAATSGSIAMPRRCSAAAAIPGREGDSVPFRVSRQQRLRFGVPAHPGYSNFLRSMMR